LRRVVTQSGIGGATPRLANRISHKPLRLFQLLALGLVMVSCDPGPPQEALGVSKTPTGGIEIRYELCPDEAIREVALFRTVGGVIGDTDDEVLWRVRSTNESHQSSFTVGDTPPGFVEEVALRALPGPEQELGVIVDTSRVQNVAVFRADDLRVGQVWVEDRNLDPTSYEEQALKRC
jgi:hypothetical protein